MSQLPTPAPSEALPQYDPARHLTIAVEGCAHGDLDRIYEVSGRYLARLMGSLVRPLSILGERRRLRR